MASWSQVDDIFPDKPDPRFQLFFTAAAKSWKEDGLFKHEILPCAASNLSQ